jgi:hypothetical protein
MCTTMKKKIPAGADARFLKTMPSDSLAQHCSGFPI